MTSHPDSAEFRRAASRFTTGVTVVGAIGAGGQVLGMTANSFVTVSARPPIVLVSLMRGRTLAAIEATGRYGVSILGSGALDATRHFAGRPIHGEPPHLAQEHGYALLPGALAHFACEVVRTLAVADHTLAIGEVRWCRCGEGRPLAFFGSEFRAGPGEPLEA